MGIKYDQIIDGEGFELDIKNEQKLKLACCDCGLVHDVAFAIEENGNLGIAMRRNNRATTAKRRANNRKLTSGINSSIS